MERAIILALAVLSEACEETNRSPLKGTLALRACLAFVTAAAGGHAHTREHAISFWRHVTGTVPRAGSNGYQQSRDRYAGALACMDILIRDLGWAATDVLRVRLMSLYREVSWPWKTHTPTGEPLPEWLEWWANCKDQPKPPETHDDQTSA